MLPVVVGTYAGSPWQSECLESLAATTRRPIYVFESTLVGKGYEPEALRWACSRHQRFLFLQDSVRVLSEAFWDQVDSHSNAWLSGWPSMCMGVLSTTDVAPHLPAEDVDKAGAIAFEAQLSTALPYATIWPDVIDRNALRREVRHGRDNLVLGVPGVWEKWKGTWR